MFNFTDGDGDSLEIVGHVTPEKAAALIVHAQNQGHDSISIVLEMDEVIRMIQVLQDWQQEQDRKWMTQG